MNPRRLIPVSTTSPPPVTRWRRRLLTLCGLLALVLPAAAPASWAKTTDTAFSISGRGWGHGIGMSQWGAYGYAKHGWDYQAILKHYYTGIGFGTKANSTIRVRLRSGLSSVKVSCAKPYRASAGSAGLDIPAGVTATTTWSGGKFLVVAGAQRASFSSAVKFTPTAGSLNLLTATDLGDTGLYRGVLRVIRDSGALMMINDVPLESYLRGVIAHEVSASWPAEALKAQACAARAFALGSRVPSRSWDVYCDVRSQAYVGVGMEDSRTDQAIRATAGVTPTYKGKAIQAFYFDCSGGHTENIEYGWPGASAVPYLKGVDDPYETSAPDHIWPGVVHKTAGQMRSPLASYVKGTLQAVYAVKLGTSPRIVKAAVIGSSGVTYIDGNELRVKLGLRSTWASVVSLSVSPAAGDHASVVLGSSVTLSGRLYPALVAGANVSLHYYYDGRWRSRLVPTTRASQKLPSGYTAVYSAYSVPVSPAKTTRYYFSSGNARSPETTVTVRAASPPARPALGAGLPPG